jgi:putative serine protease PepD
MRGDENDKELDRHMNNSILRRTAAVGAALVVGGGAGAAVYAALGGKQSAVPTTTTTVVQAQPAAATQQPVSTLTQLYKDVTPGVVDITVTSTSSDGFGFGGTQQTEAEGSGFVYDTSGDIITNEHVVAGAKSITVRFQNGDTAKAKLLGSDSSTDIAVIKVDVAASKLHPLTLGSSTGVQPGQEVVAIGSPFGLPGTMTSGIVSAVDRTIEAPNHYSISGAIQTDAPINHGNSGGPLLNASGDVVGVNAQIDSDSGGNDGVGFAIPIDAVKNVASTIVSGGKVRHSYLGVKIGDASGGPGASVGTVIAGSPAAKAGMKAGDVITAVDGRAVADADALTAAIGTRSPGSKLTLTLRRNGATRTVTVTLGVRPS